MVMYILFLNVIKNDPSNSCNHYINQNITLKETP
jgi:hypothetical protein